MSDPENIENPMAPRVYRLRLCESLHREIVSRSTCYANGQAPRDPAGVEVADMLRLKDALPLLSSEEEADRVGQQIEDALASCESELVKNIPPGNIAHYMRMAHRQSLQPYKPSDDELALE